MEVVLVVWVRVKCSSVVGDGLALAEVIALHLLVVYSKPFVIYFVEIIGLKYHGANDSDARGWFHHDVDVAEHHVPIRC